MYQTIFVRKAFVYGKTATTLFIQLFSTILTNISRVNDTEKGIALPIFFSGKYRDIDTDITFRKVS